ncbi:MAG: hypothetical protein WC307_04085 [Candidatus Nanoarchaeia archaeon]
MIKTLEQRLMNLPAGNLKGSYDTIDVYITKVSPAYTGPLLKIPTSNFNLSPINIPTFNLNLDLAKVELPSMQPASNFGLGVGIAQGIMPGLIDRYRIDGDEPQHINNELYIKKDNGFLNFKEDYGRPVPLGINTHVYGKFMGQDDDFSESALDMVKNWLKTLKD